MGRPFVSVTLESKRKSRSPQAPSDAYVLSVCEVKRTGSACIKSCKNNVYELCWNDELLFEVSVLCIYEHGHMLRCTKQHTILDDTILDDKNGHNERHLLVTVL